MRRKGSEEQKSFQVWKLVNQIDLSNLAQSIIEKLFYVIFTSAGGIFMYSSFHTHCITQRWSDEKALLFLENESAVGIYTHADWLIRDVVSIEQR